MTIHGGRPPEVTRRERDVLIELCRPAASSELFVEPASVRDIAASLRVSEAAVKQHLLKLYEKFAIEDCNERRRVALAREALRRDVVTVGELRSAAW
jgi:DNA-binding NarL/FixJ family response regulator